VKVAALADDDGSPAQDAYTPLHWAVTRVWTKNHVEMVRLLLQKGALVNAATTTVGALSTFSMMIVCVINQIV
jgi:ankyrin repeat protein